MTVAISLLVSVSTLAGIGHHNAMPQNFRAYALPEQDGRRKLSEEQKQEIRAKYKPRVYSFGMLAKEYGVNKRTIFFVVNPHKLVDFQRSRKGSWINYYDKEQHRLAVKKYRDKKRALKIKTK